MPAVGAVGPVKEPIISTFNALRAERLPESLAPRVPGRQLPPLPEGMAEILLLAPCARMADWVAVPLLGLPRADRVVLAAG